VLITAPVDRRLATTLNRAGAGPFLVRAKVVGDVPIEPVEVRVDDKEWAPMTPMPGAVWQAVVPDGILIGVRARDARGWVDKGRVECQAADWTSPQRRGDGSDGDRIGAWPEGSIFDMRLGPNRNGRA